MSGRMVDVGIMENYRTFETPDSHMTEFDCGVCGEKSEVYVTLEGWIRVCKTCLSKMEDEINKVFQNHMREAKQE